MHADLLQRAASIEGKLVAASQTGDGCRWAILKGVFVVLLLIPLILLLNLSFVQGPPPPDPDYAGQNWVLCVPPNSQFSVRLPTTPTERKNPIDYGFGKVEQTVFTSNTKRGEYVVSFSDFSELPVTEEIITKSVFLRSKEWAEKSGWGKVVKEQSFEYQGFPSHELVIELQGKPATVMTTKTVFADKRLYQLILVQPKLDGHPAETVEVYQTDATRFFSSLQIKKVK